MHSENDTPAVVRALDAISFEADLAVQELQDLGPALSDQDRASALLVAVDIRRRLAELRSGWPVFTPPPGPRYAGLKRPLGQPIHDAKRKS
jgi:hypothetical protein